MVCTFSHSFPKEGISRLVRLADRNNNSQRSPCHNLLGLKVMLCMLGFTAVNGFNVVDGIKAADQQSPEMGTVSSLSQ